MNNPLMKMSATKWVDMSKSFFYCTLADFNLRVGISPLMRDFMSIVCARADKVTCGCARYDRVHAKGHAAAFYVDSKILPPRRSL